jgi:hypothetical protein
LLEPLGRTDQPLVSADKPDLVGVDDIVDVPLRVGLTDILAVQDLVAVSEKLAVPLRVGLAEILAVLVPLRVGDRDAPAVPVIKGITELPVDHLAMELADAPSPKVAKVPPMYTSAPLDVIANTPSLFWPIATPLLEPHGSTDQALDVVDHLTMPFAEVPSARALKHPPMYTSEPTRAMAPTYPLIPRLDPLGRTDHTLNVVDHLAILFANFPSPRVLK